MLPVNVVNAVTDPYLHLQPVLTIGLYRLYAKVNKDKQ